MIRRSLMWIVPTLMLMCVVMSAHEVKAETIISFLSGNDFVEQMKAYDSECFGDVLCISATVQFAAYVRGVNEATYSQYSIPVGATPPQLAAVVSKFLKEHPERWTEPASFLVIDALKKAFPKK